MGLVCSANGHEWNGCTCVRCGKNLDRDHVFVSVPDKCETVCSICGKTGKAQHDWDGERCVKCNLSKEEYEFFAEMLALLEEGDRLNWDALMDRDGAGPGYSAPEAIQVVHRVHQAVAEKYGMEGLDSMIKMVRAEDDKSLLQYVEDNWG